MMKKKELLAPAGDLEAGYAALFYGADAVYLGLTDEPLDLLRCGDLTFHAPDLDAFPCLRIARECAKTGGTACAIMNGANEEAVGLFLRREIGFNDIPRLIEDALSRVAVKYGPGLADILEADRLARAAVLNR